MEQIQPHKENQKNSKNQIIQSFNPKTTMDNNFFLRNITFFLVFFFGRSESSQIQLIVATDYNQFQTTENTQSVMQSALNIH